MIRKYLLGGPSIFVLYTPFTAASATQADVAASDTSGTAAGRKASADSDPNKGKVNEKDILSLFDKLNGLPADLDGVVQNVSKLLKLSEMTGDSSDLSTIYLKALELIKTASFYKLQYTDARATVLNNKGLNDYAITDLGRVVVRDKEGNLTTKSIDDAINNKGTFQLVTNNELLHMRANNPNHAYDQTLLQVVENGIGMEKISDLIKSSVASLGTTGLSVSGYTQKEHNDIVKGLEFLLSNLVELAMVSGMTLNGLYKNKIGTKDLIKLAEKALAFVYDSLPENAKNLLKLNTLDSSGNSAKMYIASLILSRMSSEKSFDPDLLIDENGNKVGTKGSSEGNGDDKIKDNLYTSISLGNSGTNSTFTLMDSNGRTFSIKGTNYPNLAGNPAHPIVESSLKSLLDFLGLNALVKGGGKYPITFGDLILTDIDMENIAFKNDRLATRVIMPVKEKDGQLVPDLDFMEDNKELFNLINSKVGEAKDPMKDPQVIKALSEAGLVDPFSGLPDLKRFLVYLCINGLGTSRNIKEGAHNHEIDDEASIDRFERSVYRSKEQNGGVEYNFEFDRFNAFNPADWFPGTSDKLYEGTIFIPVTENINLTQYGTENLLGEMTRDSNETTYLGGETRRWTNALTTSSSVLGI